LSAVYKQLYSKKLWVNISEVFGNARPSDKKNN